MSSEVYDKMRQAMLEIDEDSVVEQVETALEAGLDPLKISRVLTDAIREVGEMYAKYEIFLTQLMLAGEAMTAGMALLQPKLAERNLETPSQGTVVIGTVSGDLHDIGKNMVVTMLTAGGFKVIDLGIDVSMKTFADALKTYSPEIIAASALMTTTRIEMRQLIEYLEALGIRDRCKVLIGGSAVTADYAEEIGADGFAVSCVEAVDVARELVESQRGGG